MRCCVSGLRGSTSAGASTWDGEKESMAIPVQVKIVRQGAGALAAWRNAYPEGQLDLRGVDLNSADLRDANLRDADLGDADLSNANLHNADLRDADLRYANLSHADLSSAHLNYAHLNSADLRATNFSSAVLTSADLSFADLRDANLSKVHINRDTKFEEVMVNEGTVGLGPWVFSSKRSIVREIEFPPEYHQAGVSIMNYFATVLRQKYPDIPATIQISQENLIVWMTIETDDGHREIVEQTLEDYGLVVSGEQEPSSLLPDQIDILRLENQLTFAYAQLDNERRILQVTQANYEERFRELISAVTHLRELVSGQQRHADRLVDMLELQTFTPLRALLDRGLTEADEAEVKRLLRETGQHNPSLLRRLAEQITAGAAGGTIGSANAELLVPWLQDVIQRMF